MFEHSGSRTSIQGVSADKQPFKVVLHVFLTCPGYWGQFDGAKKTLDLRKARAEKALVEPLPEPANMPCVGIVR